MMSFFSFCILRVLFLSFKYDRQETILAKEPEHSVTYTIPCTTSNTQISLRIQNYLAKHLSSPCKEILDVWLPIERKAMTQISLRICAGWSESLLGGQAILKVALCSGSNVVLNPYEGRIIICLTNNYFPTHLFLSTGCNLQVDYCNSLRIMPRFVYRFIRKRWPLGLRSHS